MATEIVEQAQQSEFFSFNAGYRVADDATSVQLMNDAMCWIDAARAIVNEAAVGLTTKGSDMEANPTQVGKMLWGAFHLLEMVDGAVNASFDSKRRDA